VVSEVKMLVEGLIRLRPELPFPDR
jgi:hypothetical protein